MYKSRRALRNTVGRPGWAPSLGLQPRHITSG